MRIAIIGTRGIPNAYGGFEQFAEYLSLYLTKKNHDVWVYSSSLHPYQQSTWNGVNIVHATDWEGKIGTAGQFIYDFNCILDARKRNYDVILQLGYTSSSIWAKLMPKNVKIITNMDGMEWKRSKFSGKVQYFLRKAEKWAVRSSNAIVADSKGIKSYLDEKYSINSTFIAYGAPVAPLREKSLLDKIGVHPGNYYLLVARMEPENNIEMILDGYSKSNETDPFIVIGKLTNEFSKHLQKKFETNDQIKFIGGIYDLELLDCLRQNCKLYFHGHSVGGTNPSLLEAMGCAICIVAHNNEFNRAVLEDDGYYFSSALEVTKIIDDESKINEERMISNNLLKIKNDYSWNNINEQYEKLFIKTLRTN
ncbi:MAG: glycosyltransferase involved in cell wall biosynthesis [Patiriisocius sp.]|jgi:glycosyltransferase involved in cell wall biosynthesis